MRNYDISFGQTHNPSLWAHLCSLSDDFEVLHDPVDRDRRGLHHLRECAVHTVAKVIVLEPFERDVSCCVSACQEGSGSVGNALRW